MSDLPVIGAQLSVLDLDRHRDWIFEKDRDIELPEFCMADILAKPEPFIAMALDKLRGWNGRLGIHGPFSGFELDVKDRDIRSIVQARLDRALEVCARLGARQMVIHSPYDPWDAQNLDNAPRGRAKSVSQILDTLAPALKRAQAEGVEMVLENIKDTDPGLRRAVVEAADTPALRLSVDTGHALWAHVSAGAPPVDRFVQDAGALLGHVHLQDADGYADRHWVLGEGDTNFHPIFDALRGLEARPHLIVEINDFSRVPESVAYLERLGLGA
ncbi:sugar phosphate isomerase/epimerase [Lutimaribacter sp. EGI FJ00015]|uniref:Sugar phosphate isomerase/epimerase n=1 Tax=Lutimaribacter degradans TaxID=2945989 RepID=A0ACC6A0X1_9RHOB|nr:sugar phosphate isomerase/epimerase family protein [Lutimaribacter sp. EGI FJ00013]MCM2563264.1 sugar phosphate isomerase/epimerase [Lutimaribacter sp. EGI FJ00013]MCO0614413.1 sugar phosphate isomerase/epimerase [Lutimaribacter sp. EGI FJ00015]MCO0635986.1 sugar phosphate isomerase/epimerase [Lutimaribacter sp. EGI FJ00014]